VEKLPLFKKNIINKISEKKKQKKSLNDVAFFIFLIENFLRGSTTWRFRLPRGDSVTVSCHGVLLRGNPENHIL
jgi:hypothetical protein